MAYKDIAYKLAKVLIYINLAGMMVGGSFVIAGHGLVAFGIEVALLSLARFIFPILLFPVTFFTNLMIYCEYKGYKLREVAMYLLSLLYMVFFFSYWTNLLMRSFLVDWHAMTFIWAICASVAPLLVWVDLEKDNQFMITMVLGVQLSAVLSGIYFYFNHVKGDFSFYALMFFSMLAFTAIVFIVEKIRQNPIIKT